MTKAIQVEDLAKSFGEVEAVRGVRFSVETGEVFGFLGPNGAGKTTTINMLCTLAKPTGGSAKVAGHDIVVRPGRSVQAAVDSANKAVSHAEAIKKFTILGVDWTEEGGQITPSLKLKRNVVMKEFAAEVAALYA